MLGQSRAILALFDDARLIATTHVNVLLAGERGVGKHIVAQFLHENSPRRHNRMLSVDCGTGGPLRMTSAHRGTLLLEDVAALIPSAQSALLAALKDGDAGSAGDDLADARIISTTTRDLLDDAEPSFDPDLYYRLNVGHLPIPPLRERREDISLLAKHYLGIMSRHFRLPACELDPAALAELEAYDWPDNLRELCDVAEMLAVTYPGRTISVDQLPESIRHRRGSSSAIGSARGAVIAADPAAIACYEQITQGAASFWTVVYEPFLAHRLSRATVRDVVALGLRQAEGCHAALTAVFNLPPTDQPRLTRFLQEYQIYRRPTPLRVVTDASPDAAPSLPKKAAV